MKCLYLLIFDVKLDVSIWARGTLGLFHSLDWIVPNPDIFQYLSLRQVISGYVVYLHFESLLYMRSCTMFPQCRIFCFSTVII